MKPYLDSQLYSECQLVALLNAWVFWGVSIPEPGSKQYEILVDCVRARYGSATSIEEAFLTLKIKPRRLPLRKDLVEKLFGQGVPVAVPVWYPETGFHICLIVNVCRIDGKINIQVANRRHKITAAKVGTWISWQTLRRAATPSLEYGVPYCPPDRNVRTPVHMYALYQTL